MFTTSRGSTPRLGLLDSGFLDDALDEAGLPELIEDLPLAFGVMVSDLRTRRGRVLTRGPLREALRASIAVPVLFPPVRTRGMVLVDGGLAANVPVGAAHRLGAELTIGVRLRPEWGVVPVPEADGQPSVWERDPTTLMVYPGHRGLNMWLTRNVPRLIDAGRAAAELAFDDPGNSDLVKRMAGRAAWKSDSGGRR